MKDPFTEMWTVADGIQAWLAAYAGAVLEYLDDPSDEKEVALRHASVMAQVNHEKWKEIWNGQSPSL